MLTEAGLLAFLEEELGVDTADVDAQMLLFSTGIIDSFALVTLMTYLETEGGFRISPVDVNLGNMDSIARMLAYAERATT